MIARSSVIRVLPIVLAGSLALPATTAAKADPCAADRRLVNAWDKVVDDNTRITQRQTTILAEIFRLLAANQTIPRGPVDELQGLVAKNRQVIAAGEKRILRITPGTANGRALKRLVLRFLRVVARPLNSCIGKLLVADSPAEMDEVVRCNDSAGRAQVALSREIDRALKRMAAKRTVCARARP